VESKEERTRNAAQDRKDGLRENVRVSRGTRWAIGSLLLLVLIIGGANLLSSYLQFQSFKSTQQQQFQQFTATQQEQSKVIDERLCATLDRLAALKAPSGDVGDNPSRAYEQQLAMTLAQLKPDVGCSP
jgi:hypothetical protein